MRRILVAAFIVAFCAAGGSIFYFVIVPYVNQTRILSYDGRIEGKTKEQVAIVRDRFGIPEIRAARNEDFFYALGYIHAQDRLHIMEYHRSIASGHADKIIPGDDGKILGRLYLMLDSAGMARETLSRLREPYIGYFEAYADGINAWKYGKAHHLSMKVPRGDHPWTAEEVLSVHYFREWTNSFLNNREIQFPISEKKNTILFDDLFPDNYITYYKEMYYPYVNLLRFVRGAIIRQIGSGEEGFSLFMPAYGEEQPRLAVHRENAGKQYPVWYPVRLRQNDKTFYMMTEAGLPFVQASISDKFSFSITSAHLDSMNIYMVPVSENEGDQNYFADNAWKKFTKKQDVADSEQFEYRCTDFGPVISDLVRLEDKEICVVVDNIRNDTADIVFRFDLPFAAGTGQAIGLASASSGYPHALMVTSGREGISLLSGTVPEPQMKGSFFTERRYPPRMINLSMYRGFAKNGILVSSSRITPEAFPALRDYAVYFPSEREDVCIDALKKDPTLAALMKAVNSSDSPVLTRMSRAYAKLLTGILVTSSKLSRSYLIEWNGDFAGGSIPPTIMHQIYFSLMDETLADELGSEIGVLHDNPTSVYDKLIPLLEQGDSKLFDNITTTEDTESINKTFGIAFLKAMRILHRHYGPEMGKWRWNRVTPPVFEIPFSRSDKLLVFAEHSTYDSSTHYSARVSYQEKGNIMSAIPVGNCTMLRWGQVFWGSNMNLSTNSNSEYYGNAPAGKRMLIFHDNKKMHETIIEPAQL